ncbi:PREDICTED: uncharacterized protein LOC108764859 [Trachymyrmex cornetzi]|uniref:uncharacterized protein LOC108764859 n=1 Tax=Trachymyrmex cornetzi TaxID=471704 RepID=UPI00084F2C74|nr:PREDICTED: uncharacterized protein LOC108764859 [Trachymyrmex cornetzi]
MYGVPICAVDVVENRRICDNVARVWRRVALRVICAYRTVSYEASAILSRIPFRILALRYRAVYSRTKEVIIGNGFILPRTRDRIKAVECKRTVETWRGELLTLSPSTPGYRVRAALIEVLPTWMGRTGGLTFHMTQIITGHGCFQDYLYEIRRAEFPACMHCMGAADSARHTLETCPTWGEQRAVLTAIVGSDLSIVTILRAALRSNMRWEGFKRFCEEINNADQKAKAKAMLKNTVLKDKQQQMNKTPEDKSSKQDRDAEDILSIFDE